MRTARRLAILAMTLAGIAPAAADRIKHPTASFAGLDKITGRIITFDVAIDETVQFGSLQLTPRVCYTRPPTEAPNTTGFVEVDELQDDKKTRRIFSGWMFVSSPGLHGVEHPVYDVWLTDCKGGTEVVASPGGAGPEAAPPNADNAPKGSFGRSRQPRRTIEPVTPPPEELSPDNSGGMDDSAPMDAAPPPARQTPRGGAAPGRGRRAPAQDDFSAPPERDPDGE